VADSLLLGALGLVLLGLSAVLRVRRRLGGSSFALRRASAPSDWQVVRDGEYIDSLPADAVTPAECAKYPLYLVSMVINQS
jgi:hypothetical protein